MAVVALAASAIGPMFLQSADDSVLASAAAATAPGSNDVNFVVAGGAAADVEIRSAARLAQRVVGDRLLERPRFTADIGVRFSEPGIAAFESEVLWRTDICSHLRFVAGSCPRTIGAVALSSRSATLAHRQLGSLIEARIAASTSSVALRVVGVYLAPTSTDDSYWAEVDYFKYGIAAGRSIEIDPMVATEATDIALARRTAPVAFSADLPWRSSALAAGRSRIDAGVASVEAKLSRHYGITIATGLPTLFSSVQGDEALMSDVILASVLQLVLLSLLVLFALGRSTASARRPEAEFARLHGFSRRALVSLAVSEPAALVVAAYPAGILLAWGLLELLGDRLFVTGTPIAVTPLALLSALAGLVAALGATLVATYGLWRRRSAGHGDRVAAPTLAVDGFGVGLALAGLLALVTRGALNGSHADPLAELAPGLLALGAAIIGLRAIAVVVARLIGPSRGSPHVAWFLSLRRLRRRPELLRRMLPLAVAITIVCFALGSFIVAAANRSRAANFEVGADRVVDVSVPPGVDLVRAVRAADPTGREAMAAAVYNGPGGTLLAVDSSRLAAVGAWPTGLSSHSVAMIARRLSPPLPASVAITGTRLAMTIALPPKTPAMLFYLTVFDERYQVASELSLGPTSPGRHTYSTTLEGACTERCRLVTVGPTWFNGNAGSFGVVTARLDAVRQYGPRGWQPVNFGGGTPGTWRSESSGLVVRSDVGGVPGVVMTIDGSTLVGGDEITPSDLPTNIPAVVTTSIGAAHPPARIPYTGLDGNPITLAPIAEVRTLPLVGANAALVDFSFAELAQSGPAIDATDKVWLTAGASSNILSRLRREGFGIGSSAYASVRLGQLDRSGLALAYDLPLIIAPIAVLLAIGGVVYEMAAEGRRRRIEIAALMVAGVDRRRLRRAVLVENTLVVLSALLIGGAIGFAADALVLPSLPQLSGSGGAGLPLVSGVPIASLLAAITGLAVLLFVATTATSQRIFAQAVGASSGAS